MTEETLKRKLDTEPEAEVKKTKTDVDAETPVNEEKSNANASAETKADSNESIKSTDQKEEAEKEKPEEDKENDEEKNEDNGNDKEDADKDEKKTDSPAPKESEKVTLTEGEATPKDSTPVFGSKSSFGNAFKKSAEKPDIFASSSNDSTATPFGSTGLLFGSKSKFGNAFQQTLLKPSFLDSPEPKEASEDSVDDSKPKLSQQYKQVDLEEKKVTTGEENEESVFSATVKVFELDLSNIKEGWKERGVGPLHLNRSLLDPKEVRIVMRSQGLLRVVLNYKITPETELLKGLEASLSPGKFLRLNSVTDGRVVQYLIKFGNETIREGLVSKVTELQKHIAKD